MPIVRNAGDLDIEYLVRHSNSKFYDDYVPINLSSRKHEIIRVSTDRLTIKLIDKTQSDLLSIIDGRIKIHNNIEYYEIVSTYSKIERSGFLTYLFEVLVYEFDYKVLSDSQQSSPGSKEFWQAHIRRNKFSVYRLNLDTNYKRKANGFKEDQIWREVKNDSVTSFYSPIDYSIEDDDIDDFENLDDFDSEFDEITKIVNENEVSDELVYGDIEDDSLFYERIRLVAQKYVG